MVGSSSFALEATRSDSAPTLSPLPPLTRERRCEPRVIQYQAGPAPDSWAVHLLSLYPCILFSILAGAASCFILIAYFRLKKLVFLDYFDVEMGAGEQFTFIQWCVFLSTLLC